LNKYEKNKPTEKYKRTHSITIGAKLKAKLSSEGLVKNKNPSNTTRDNPEANRYFLFLEILIIRPIVHQKRDTSYESKNSYSFGGRVPQAFRPTFCYRSKSGQKPRSQMKKRY